MCMLIVCFRGSVLLTRTMLRRVACLHMPCTVHTENTLWGELKYLQLSLSPSQCYNTSSLSSKFCRPDDHSIFKHFQCSYTIITSRLIFFAMYICIFSDSRDIFLVIKHSTFLGKRSTSNIWCL